MTPHHWGDKSSQIPLIGIQGLSQVWLDYSPNTHMDLLTLNHSLVSG